MNRLSLFIMGIVLLTHSGCVSTCRTGSPWERFGLFDGLAVICTRDFGGQSSIDLADGMASDAWMAPTTLKVGIPLLLTFHIDQAPYHLRFQLRDENQQYKSIEICEALLEYPNGECVRKSVDWKRTLKDSTQHLNVGSESIELKLPPLTEFMEEIVDRHQDVKITLSGNMVNVIGETIAFSTCIKFEAESSFLVAPTWLILMGV